MRSAVRSREHPAYWAFVVHRASGVALAFFLPLHFLALGLALEGGARLDGFLVWTQQPLVRLGEALMVAALAAHLAGGLRLLALEFVGWSERWRAFVAVGAAVAFAFGLAVLLGI